MLGGDAAERAEVAQAQQSTVNAAAAFWLRMTHGVLCTEGGPSLKVKELIAATDNICTRQAER